MYDYRFTKKIDSVMGHVASALGALGPLDNMFKGWPDNFEFVNTSDTKNAAAGAIRDGDYYVLEIDLPGVKPNGVKVTASVRSRSVKVTSTREAGKNVSTKTVKYSLPEDADTAYATAVLQNGVLTLRFPTVSQEDDSVNIPVTI